MVPVYLEVQGMLHSVRKKTSPSALGYNRPISAGSTLRAGVRAVGPDVIGPIDVLQSKARGPLFSDPD